MVAGGGGRRGLTLDASQSFTYRVPSSVATRNQSDGAPTQHSSSGANGAAGEDDANNKPDPDDALSGEDGAEPIMPATSRERSHDPLPTRPALLPGGDGEPGRAASYSPDVTRFRNKPSGEPEPPAPAPAPDEGVAPPAPTTDGVDVDRVSRALVRDIDSDSRALDGRVCVCVCACATPPTEGELGADPIGDADAASLPSASTIGACCGDAPVTVATLGGRFASNRAVRSSLAAGDCGCDSESPRSACVRFAGLAPNSPFIVRVSSNSHAMASTQFEPRARRRSVASSRARAR